MNTRLIVAALGALVLFDARGWAQDIELADVALAPPSTAFESSEALDVARERLRLEMATRREERPEKELVARAGEWKSRRSDPEVRSWQVQLERDLKTDEIRGTIRINGSRVLAHAARIEGRLEGSSVNGVLIDDAGRELGFFSGTLSGEEMTGTYETVTGDVGDWSYRDWQAGAETRRLSRVAARQAERQAVSQSAVVTAE